MRGRLAHWMWRSGVGLGLTVALVAFTSPAVAQTLTSVSAVKNAGNSGDEFSDGLLESYQRQTTVVVVSSSTTFFRVRYQEIVAADVGVGGSDKTESQNTDYQVNFNVTVPGAYRLNIATSVKGAFTVVDDGNNGSVDMSQIVGSQTGG